MEVSSGSINNIVIPQHPVVANLHSLLTSIPTRCQFFIMTDLCSAFLSIPVDEATQYLLGFTCEEKQFTWIVMPQSFTESPSYFSQILKADMGDIKFPRGSTLLQYAGYLLLCSPSQAPHRKTTSIA